jgi:membrane-associated phospholipid phosphatase
MISIDLSKNKSLNYGILRNIMLHCIGPIAKAVIAADITLFKIINAHHTPFFDWFFSFVSYLGNGWLMIPLFFIFIFWKTPKSRRMRILVVAAVALSISGICNSAAKQLIDRPRPAAYFVSLSPNTAIEEGHSYKVHVVGKRFVDHSLPSGHANTAFTIATLALLIFGRRFWPTFLVAIAVAYSRVYAGVHFPLDTLAGACIGSIIAFVVWYGAAIVASQKPS